jgi:hypothetical protein
MAMIAMTTSNSIKVKPARALQARFAANEFMAFGM